MPRVDDLIDQVAGSPYITTLDLTKEYWRVAVAEKDHEKTAFMTPFGFFTGGTSHVSEVFDKNLNGLNEFAGARHGASTSST